MGDLPQLEGVLRRWSRHPAADSLLLRGGLLTRQLVDVDRTVDDVDFLATYAHDPRRTERDLRDALGLEGPALECVDIFAETAFPGIRCLAQLDGSEVQIDVGYGDPATASILEYTCLDGEILQIPSVDRETMISWKLHGIFERTDNTWRVKDLHDLDLLLSGDWNEDALIAAVELAFSSRDAPLRLIRRVWSGQFGTSRRSRKKWEKFVRDHPERQPSSDIASTIASVSAVIRPLLETRIPEDPPPFPVSPSLEEMRAAIAGEPVFHIHTPRDWSVFSYRYKSTDLFGDPDRAITHTAFDRSRLRLECRGITFDTDGRCIARPFHTFFNYNAKTDRVDGAWILEKLDGSLIFPTPTADGWIWRTRRGPSSIADGAGAFAAKSDADFSGFLTEVEGEEWTACFEWCSRSQRIVLDHPVDRLVLVALRHRRTGTYRSPPEVAAIAKRYGIESVGQLGRVENIEDLVSEVAEGVDGEGVVLQTADHRLYKIKSSLYRRLHAVVEGENPALPALKLILAGHRDEVADVWAGRGGDLTPFLEAFDAHWASLVARLTAEAASYSQRRELAMAIQERSRLERGALFSAFEGRDVAETLLKANPRDLLATLDLPELK